MNLLLLCYVMYKFVAANFVFPSLQGLCWSVTRISPDWKSSWLKGHHRDIAWRRRLLFAESSAFSQQAQHGTTDVLLTTEKWLVSVFHLFDTVNWRDYRVKPERSSEFGETMMLTRSFCLFLCYAWNIENIRTQSICVFGIISYLQQVHPSRNGALCISRA